jgi:hypothetical protein
MKSLLFCVVFCLTTLALLNAAAIPQPIQHRIALTPDGMSVSWSTVGNIEHEPRIRYGKNPLTLDKEEKGETKHYDPSITWFHHVVLKKLERNTRYYWQVVTGDEKVYSPIMSFETAPEVGEEKPFRFAVYGDFGLGNFEPTMNSLRLIKDSFDLVWHIGDLAYADDYERLGMSYEEIQEQWMNDMSIGYWTDLPYMFTPGNHEAVCNEGHPDVCPLGQLNFTSYRYRYRMPYEEAGSESPLFYSFDYGLVHFISLDTEVDYPDSPEGPGTKMNCGPFGDQLTWLRKDLEKAVANRHNVPWIVAGGHHPYYAAGDRAEYMNASSAAFEKLMNDYNVDAVFWGHIHNTQRMWPTGLGGVVTQKDYHNAKNPAYFISASVGNVEGLTSYSKKDEHDFIAYANGDDYGIGYIDVFNATTLRWQFIESVSLKVLDEAYITKDPISKATSF